MSESLLIKNCHDKINKLNNKYSIFPKYEIKILYFEEMYSDYHQLELEYFDNNRYYCRYFTDAYALINYLDGVSLGIQHTKYKNKSQ